MKKILSVLLSVSMVFSLFGINTFAKEDAIILKEELNDIEVVETDNIDEYSEEISEIIGEQFASDNFVPEEGLNDRYYSCRIVVCSENVKEIDFSPYAPETIVYNENGRYAVLQFNDEISAKKCDKALNQNPLVNFAEPDIVVKGTDEIKESYSGISASNLSWGTSYINADKFASYLYANNYNTRVTVAVVDTGVDLDHEFLSKRIVAGYDYIALDSVPDDENGHGTHVAGTIVDCTQNLNVMIMPVRVLAADGYGTSLAISSGVTYAAEHGANVINMSLSGGHTFIEEDAIKSAIKSGVLVCCAAGNDSERITDLCPAHMSEPIVVSAIDRYNGLAYFSNYGTSVDICGPGVSVYSSDIPNDYSYKSGTSMATPHIAASCALLKVRYPNYSVSKIEKLLKGICTDIGTAGNDIYFGAGYVNFNNLLNEKKHVVGDWETSLYPTCQTDGLYARLCLICGEIIESQVLPADKDSHDYIRNVVFATCTEDGKVSQICSVCGKENIISTTKATGHTIGDWTLGKAATCNADGYNVRKCTVCNAELEKDTIPATGNHTYKTRVQKPTCTADGYTAHRCTVCGYTYNTDTVPASGHNLGEWEITKNSTCIEEGTKVKKCSTCKKTVETESIEASAHTPGTPVITVQPTCTLPGKKVTSCTVCTANIKTESIEALDHTLGDWTITKASTCTSDGERVKVCSACNKTIETETITASGHDYERNVVNPTCTEQGYTESKCKNCDYSSKGDYKDPLGHTEGEWEVSIPATQTEKGLEVVKCTVCGEVLDSREITLFEFTENEETDTVIDKEKGIIYGLEEGITDLEDYVEYSGCELVYHETENGFGTGTVVDVVANGEVIDSYTIVIFGDVTGDGYIDSFDSALLISVANFEIEIDEESAYYLAADLENDGFIDSFDSAMLISASNFEMEISQTR